MLEIHQVNPHMTIVVLERKKTHQTFINVVLLKVHNGEYTTHLENTQFDKFTIVNGHYFNNLESALKDFKNRL